MESDKVFSSFGSRFVASLIDAVIMLIPMMILGMIVPFVGPLVIGLFYKPIFEASLAQATPGKRIMGLVVSDLNGNRITIKAAFIRYAISFLSCLLLCIGHIVALFTEKKQSVHDLVADTIVTDGKMGGELFQDWSDQVKSLFSSEAFSNKNNPIPSDMSRLDILERLHKLRESGAITDEEYDKQKQSLLKEK